MVPLVVVTDETVDAALAGEAARRRASNAASGVAAILGMARHLSPSPNSLGGRADKAPICKNIARERSDARSTH